MRVMIPQAALRDLLADVKPFISSRSPLPIFNNYLIGAANGTLSVYGTDSTLACLTGRPCEVAREGRITINAAQFFSIVASLPPADVTIDCPDGVMTTITCQRSRFRMNGIAASEFPEPLKPADGPILELPAPLLAEVMTKTAYAVSADETSILGGLYMRIEERVMEVAAMSHQRMTYWKGEVEAEPAEPLQFTLARRMVTEVQRMLKGYKENVQLYRLNNMLAFAIGDAFITGRVLAGDYPLSFRAAIPKGFAAKPEMDRASLVAALQRLSNITDEREAHTLLFEFDGTELTIRTREGQVGDGQDVVACSEVPQKFVMLLPCPYVLDALKAVDSETIAIGYNDALYPALFFSDRADDPLTTLVMPHRLIPNAVAGAA